MAVSQGGARPWLELYQSQAEIFKGFIGHRCKGFVRSIKIVFSLLFGNMTFDSQECPVWNRGRRDRAGIVSENRRPRGGAPDEC